MTNANKCVIICNRFEKQPLLEVTNYGTIKGNSKFKEIGIDAFINELEHNVDTYSYRLDDESRTYEVEYYAYVIDKGDNNYQIISFDDDNLLKLDEKSKHYPFLKKNLDKLAKLTQKNLEKQNSINDLEKNIRVENHDNQKDIQTYLNFIKKRKKFHLIRSIVNASIIGSVNLSFFKLYSLLFSWFLSFGGKIFSLFICFLIACLVNSVLDWFNLYDNLSKSIQMNKLLKLKVKSFGERLDILRRANIKVKNQTVINNKSESDYYKETIIGYIGNLSKAIEKLDKKESHGIYLELRNILDEYETKMIEYNSNKEKGLTLDYYKMNIMKKTIDRLATLEVQIAEIKKRDNINQQIKNDSTVLRAKLDEYIAATSQWQVEVKPKVRTRSKED